MAKAQGISLNPGEITGICGRLRCCLIYEYDQYAEARGRLPKRGKRVQTPRGIGRVAEVFPLRDGILVDFGEEAGTVEFTREEVHPIDDAAMPIRDETDAPDSGKPKNGNSLRGLPARGNNRTGFLPFSRGRLNPCPMSCPSCSEDPLAPDGWFFPAEPDDEHVERALALVEHAGTAVAVVPTAEFLAMAEEALDPWIAVTGWSGRAVDCSSPEIAEEQVSEATLILLPDGAPADLYVEALGQTDIGEFLLSALDGGAVIVAAGTAAESMGELIADSSADRNPDTHSGGDGHRAGVPALRWIPGAIIQSHFSPGIPIPAALKRKDLFRIGLPEGAAIALGPEDEREIWGEPKPVITFRGWWNA